MRAELRGVLGWRGSGRLAAAVLAAVVVCWEACAWAAWTPRQCETSVFEGFVRTSDRKHTYAITRDPLTFDGASAMAKTYGGELAIAMSASENDFIFGSFRTFVPASSDNGLYLDRYWWIGLYSLAASSVPGCGYNALYRFCQLGQQYAGYGYGSPWNCGATYASRSSVCLVPDELWFYMNGQPLKPGGTGTPLYVNWDDPFEPRNLCYNGRGRALPYPTGGTYLSDETAWDGALNPVASDYYCNRTPNDCWDGFYTTTSNGRPAAVFDFGGMVGKGHGDRDFFTDCQGEPWAGMSADNGRWVTRGVHFNVAPDFVPRAKAVVEWGEVLTCLEPPAPAPVDQCAHPDFERIIAWNGHTYAITRDTMSWSYAANMAGSYGAHLVIVDSAEKNAFLLEKYGYYTQYMLPPGTVASGGLWIGIYDALGGYGNFCMDGDPCTPYDARFAWVDRVNRAYRNWDSAGMEPNNRCYNDDVNIGGCRGENHVYMKTDGTWADDGPHYRYGSGTSSTPLRRAIVEFEEVLNCTNLPPPRPGSDNGVQNWVCGKDFDGDGVVEEAEYQRCVGTPQGRLCPFDRLECGADNTATLPPFDPICPPGGTLDAVADRCVAIPFANCPTGFAVDNVTGVCFQQVDCPSKGSFDGQRDQCQKPPDVSRCPGGYVYVDNVASCVYGRVACTGGVTPPTIWTPPSSDVPYGSRYYIPESGTCCWHAYGSWIDNGYVNGSGSTTGTMVQLNNPPAGSCQDNWVTPPSGPGCCYWEKAMNCPAGGSYNTATDRCEAPAAFTCPSEVVWYCDDLHTGYNGEYWCGSYGMRSETLYYAYDNAAKACLASPLCYKTNDPHENIYGPELQNVIARRGSYNPATNRCELTPGRTCYQTTDFYNGPENFDPGEIILGMGYSPSLYASGSRRIGRCEREVACDAGWIAMARSCVPGDNTYRCWDNTASCREMTLSFYDNTLRWVESCHPDGMYTYVKPDIWYDRNTGKCVTDQIAVCPDNTFDLDMNTVSCLKSPPCPRGSTFDKEVVKCTAEVQYACQGGYVYQAAIGRCALPPVCARGSAFNPATDRCESQVLPQCPDLYAYSASDNYCVASASCASGGTLDNDVCATSFVYACPTGYAYNGVSLLCEKEARCDNTGAVNPLTDRCEMIPMPLCPVGFSFDNAANLCGKYPYCGDNGTFLAARDLCDHDPNFKCPDVDNSYVPPTVNYGRWTASVPYCEMPPKCVAGTTYNFVSAKCEVGFTADCPTGFSYDASVDNCWRYATCPGGGILNPASHYCEFMASISCPPGFTYDFTLKTCAGNPQCQYGATYSTEHDKCEAAVQYSCPTGYALDYFLMRCLRDPYCAPPGTYNAATDNCEMLGYLDCSPPYAYNAARDACENPPSCPPGGVFVVDIDKCRAVSTMQCAAGYALDNTGTLCVRPAEECDAGGTYSAQEGKCVATPSKVCPAGYSFSVADTACYRSPPTCGSMGTYLPAEDVCQTEMLHLCPAGYSYVSADDVCRKDVYCPSGGTFDPLLEQCRATGNVICPTGYTYDGGTQKCWRSPYCPVGGLFVTMNRRCEAPGANSCPTGYVWDAGLSVCKATPPCPPGSTYDSGLRMCRVAGSRECPTGYSFNPTENRCERQPPDCPSGGTYNAPFVRCDATASPACPSGGTYNVGAGRCETPTYCDSGGARLTDLDQCRTYVQNVCPAATTFDNVYGSNLCVGDNASCPAGSTIVEGTKGAGWGSYLASCFATPTGRCPSDTVATVGAECRRPAHCLPGGIVNATVFVPSLGSPSQMCESNTVQPAVTTDNVCPPNFSYDPPLDLCYRVPDSNGFCREPNVDNVVSGNGTYTANYCSVCTYFGVGGSGGMCQVDDYRAGHTSCASNYPDTPASVGWGANAAQYCVRAAEPCPTGGSFNFGTYRCEAVSTPSCPTGSTYNSVTTRCERYPDCPAPGAYNSSLGACESNPETLSCPGSFTYDNVANRCYGVPGCEPTAALQDYWGTCAPPSGFGAGTYGAACYSDVGPTPPSSCPPGYVPDGPVAGIGYYCYGPPTCSAGTYGGSFGSCVCSESPTPLTCPTGYALSAGVCQTSSSCPVGWTPNAFGMCDQPVQTYTCPPGYSQSGLICTGSYSCPTPAENYPYAWWTYIWTGSGYRDFCYTYSYTNCDEPPYDHHYNPPYSPWTCWRYADSCNTNAPAARLGNVLADPFGAENDYENWRVPTTAGNCASVIDNNYPPSRAPWATGWSWNSSYASCTLYGKYLCYVYKDNTASSLPDCPTDTTTLNHPLYDAYNRFSFLGSVNTLDFYDIPPGYQEYSWNPKTSSYGYRRPSNNLLISWKRRPGYDNVCRHVPWCETTDGYRTLMNLYPGWGAASCFEPFSPGCPSGLSYYPPLPTDNSYGSCSGGSTCPYGLWRDDYNWSPYVNYQGRCVAWASQACPGGYSQQYVMDVNDNVWKNMCVRTVQCPSWAPNQELATDLCWYSGTMTCPAGYAYSSPICVALPSCPYGGQLNTGLGMCVDNGVLVCPNGFTLSGSTCVASPGGCLVGGSFDNATGLCVGPGTFECPAGYAAVGNQCLALPTCLDNADAYNDNTLRCERLRDIGCPSPYVPATDNDWCEFPPACSDNGALVVATGKCEIADVEACTTGYSFDAGRRCLGPAVCDPAGWQDNALDRCVFPMDGACPAGYSFNGLNRCLAPPSCPSSGTLRTVQIDNVANDNDCPAGYAYDNEARRCWEQHCELPAFLGCTADFWYDNATGMCYAWPACDNGAYDNDTNVCVGPGSRRCEAGYALLGDGRHCWASWTCPDNGAINRSISMCELVVALRCPPGFVYDNAAGSCLGDAICQAGSLNGTYDKCVSAPSVICPEGWMWSDAIQKCIVMPYCASGDYVFGRSRCETPAGANCPDGTTYVAPARICQATPSCGGAGFALNPSLGTCETLAIPLCPAETNYAYEDNTHRCVGAPACDPGSYDAGEKRCEVAWEPKCEPTYLYNATAVSCQQDPVCDNGVYSNVYHLCVGARSISCLTGYEYNETNGRCEADPLCAAGGLFSPANDRCEAASPPPCPDNAFTQVDNTCEGPFTCVSPGTYDSMLKTCADNASSSCADNTFAIETTAAGPKCTREVPCPVYGSMASELRGLFVSGVFDYYCWFKPDISCPRHTVYNTQVVNEPSGGSYGFYYNMEDGHAGVGSFCGSQFTISHCTSTGTLFWQYNEAERKCESQPYCELGPVVTRIPGGMCTGCYAVGAYTYCGFAFEKQFLCTWGGDGEGGRYQQNGAGGWQMNTYCPENRYSCGAELNSCGGYHNSAAGCRDANPMACFNEGGVISAPFVCDYPAPTYVTYKIDAEYGQCVAPPDSGCPNVCLDVFNRPMYFCPMNYDQARDVCYDLPDCPTDQTTGRKMQLDTQLDRCKSQPSTRCASGYSPDQAAGVCQAAVTCPNGGGIAPEKDACLGTPAAFCPTGYRYDNVSMLCLIKPAPCPEGSAYSANNDRCEQATTFSCPDAKYSRTACPPPSVFIPGAGTCEEPASTYSTCVDTGVTYPSDLECFAACTTGSQVCANGCPLRSDGTPDPAAYVKERSRCEGSTVGMATCPLTGSSYSDKWTCDEVCNQFSYCGGSGCTSQVLRVRQAVGVSTACNADNAICYTGSCYPYPEGVLMSSIVIDSSAGMTKVGTGWECKAGVGGAYEYYDITTMACPSYTCPLGAALECRPVMQVVDTVGTKQPLPGIAPFCTNSSLCTAECTAGYVWDAVGGACVAYIPLSCSAGYHEVVRFDSVAGISRRACVNDNVNGKCWVAPECYAGTFDNVADQCIPPGSVRCPYGDAFGCMDDNTTPGRQLCSPYECVDVGAGNDNTGVVQDNTAPLDNTGNCTGVVKIFSGTGRTCRKYYLWGGIGIGGGDGCCDKDRGLWSGCDEGEIALGQILKDTPYKCHYVGQWDDSVFLIGKVKTTRSYCCFRTRLARIVQEQGRQQINRTWGSAQSPDCRGFTSDEFQKLNIGKMDLSEFYNDIVKKSTNEVKRQINSEVNDLMESIQ